MQRKRRRVFLLAHPAGHSLSPSMHAAAFAAAGIDASYEAWDVAPEALGGAFARLREPDVLGANVTIPHKEAALALVDRATEAAAAIGAVNTVVPKGGALEGDNTDAEGFLAALAELGVDPHGAGVVVLGAGGAARAVVYALARRGARVRLVNRTPERADRLARAMGRFGDVATLPDEQRDSAVRGCDLLVNTTSVGMHGAAEGLSPLPDGVLPRAGAVLDLVYRPAETVLLADARRAGLAVQNGLPMLVHQGAASFERWTGVRPAVEAMRRAAQAGA